MQEADEEILTQLREAVLRPDLVEGALSDALAMLRPQNDIIEARRAELQRQLRALDEETGRLAAAIAAGGEMSALVAALGERERQREVLKLDAAGLESLAKVSQADVHRLESSLRAKVKDWRAVLGRQAPISRQIVAKLLDGRIVFTPQEDRSWTYVGQASYGKILQGVVLPWRWRPQRDSNPCFGLERATSWASGRWGPGRR